MRKIRSAHDEFETTIVVDDNGATVATITRDLTMPAVWTAYRGGTARDFRSYREAVRFAS